MRLMDSDGSGKKGVEGGRMEQRACVCDFPLLENGERRWTTSCFASISDEILQSLAQSTKRETPP